MGTVFLSDRVEGYQVMRHPVGRGRRKSRPKRIRRASKNLSAHSLLMHHLRSSEEMMRQAHEDICPID